MGPDLSLQTAASPLLTVYLSGLPVTPSLRGGRGQWPAVPECLRINASFPACSALKTPGALFPSQACPSASGRTGPGTFHQFRLLPGSSSALTSALAYRLLGGECQLHGAFLVPAKYQAQCCGSST